ncbi:hypothetical protein NLI96_g503 [Meripilus lineatus]|uniref:C3H1-type domain-containing protein n=1 Tax=Meripilus lineatus TaxID=2056292 RepID=A0AAD5YLX7_9APHY|nr:hypothetical protein NLI96_g503 [Physisporinus lineatus]
MGSPTVRSLVWSLDSQRTANRRSSSSSAPTQAHPLYRTKPCRNFANGCCRFGDSCAYLHANTSPKSHFSSPSAYASSSTLSLGSCLSRPLIGEDGCPKNSTVNPPSPISTDLTSEAESSSMRGTDDGQTFSSRGSDKVPTSQPPVESIKRKEGSRSRRGSRSRPGPLLGINHYRTKPCRFYALNGECVKGERCNFIHDVGKFSSLRAPQVDPAMPSPTTTIKPSDVHSEATHKKSAPSNGSSEKSASKNFFPITWRVIGGGCQDGRKSWERTASSPIPIFMMIFLMCQRSDLITSPPPVMYFPICDILSPVSIASPISPLCLMSPMSLSSFHVPALVPSTPPVVQLPPRKKSSKPKKKLIITPPEAIELSFHRVVDGTTLLDRELPQVRIEKEPDEEYTTSTETPSLGGLFCARSIARPMSTPPVVHHDKVVKLFAAEA